MTQEELRRELRDIENNAPSRSVMFDDMLELINTHVKEEKKALIGTDELESPIVKPKRGRPRKHKSSVTFTKINLSAQIRNKFRHELRLRAGIEEKK